MSLTLMFDAVGGNVGKLPAHQQWAGYTTGVGIAWTEAQFASGSGVVRIDQDPAASDHTADVLDDEAGAASDQAAIAWFTATLASYKAVTRPGQRYPCVYRSQAGLASLNAAFAASGLTEVPHQWVANWSAPIPADLPQIREIGGHGPIVGFQIASFADYDLSIMSAAWLAGVSRITPPSPPLWASQAEHTLTAAAASITTVAAAIAANVK